MNEKEKEIIRGKGIKYKRQFGARSSYQCNVPRKDRTTLDVLYVVLPCIARGYLCDSNP